MQSSPWPWLTLRRRNQLSHSALEKGNLSRGTGPLRLETRPAREVSPLSQPTGEEEGKDLTLHRERDLWVSLHSTGVCLHLDVTLMDMGQPSLVSGDGDVGPWCPLHAAAATPPFPARFTECTGFYEALQSQAHTTAQAHTQPEQHLCGFASRHERNL